MGKKKKSEVTDPNQKFRKPSDPRLKNLRNDSSIIYVNMQSKDNLSKKPSNLTTTNQSKPKKKQQLTSEDEVRVDKIEHPREKEPYDALLDSERQKLGKKMGGKLLVEDDYIKDSDFVDHDRHKALQEKAKKNVERAANKRKNSASPAQRKPSVASASRKRSKPRDKDGRRNTPTPDKDRPISQELDRESNRSDPYKIMDQAKQSQESSSIPVAKPFVQVIKPSTAQTQPNPDVDQVPEPHRDGLLKSQEFITPT